MVVEISEEEEGFRVEGLAQHYRFNIRAGDFVEIGCNFNNFHGICISSRGAWNQRIILRNYMHRECIEKGYR